MCRLLSLALVCNNAAVSFHEVVATQLLSIPHHIMICQVILILLSCYQTLRVRNIFNAGQTNQFIGKQVELAVLESLASIWQSQSACHFVILSLSRNLGFVDIIMNTELFIIFRSI